VKQNLQLSVPHEHHSRDFLRRILEAVPGGIMAVDHEWVITFANHKARVLLGLPERNVTGGSLLDLSPEPAGGIAWEQLRRAKNERVTIVTELYFDSLGEWFEVQTIPDGDGLIVFCRDLNLSVKAEPAQQATALALKMDHELRTALNSILGFAGLLKDADPADSANYVRYIENAGKLLLAAFEADLKEFHSRLGIIETHPDTLDQGG
jgi:PAS domain S-box-containing protein